MSSSDESGTSFLDMFCTMNPFFVAVDEEYVEDTFNLTGIRKMLGDQTDRYQDALNHILEGGTLSSGLAVATVKVFGLIHARFVTTVRGGQLLLEKVEQGVYGECPRYLCRGAHLMPVGLSDMIDQQPLKLFCPRCQELYNCATPIVWGNSLRFLFEGAYFGTSATSMLVLTNPHLMAKPAVAEEPYRLRIYGFLISPLSNLSLKSSGADSSTPQAASAASAAAAAVTANGAGVASSNSAAGLAVAFPSSGASDVVLEDEEDVARNQKKRDRGSVKEVDL